MWRQVVSPGDKSDNDNDNDDDDTDNDTADNKDNEPIGVCGIWHPNKDMLFPHLNGDWDKVTQQDFWGQVETLNDMFIIQASSHIGLAAKKLINITTTTNSVLSDEGNKPLQQKISTSIVPY